MIPLLPYEKRLAQILGVSEKEYQQWKAITLERSIQRPAEGPVCGPLVPVLVNLAIAVGTTLLSSLLFPARQQQQSRIEVSQGKRDSRTSNQRLSPRFGFSSVQEPAEVGQFVPVVIAKRENGIGGVRVAMPMLWSQMLAYNGSCMFRGIFLAGSADMASNAWDPRGWAFGNNTLGAYSYTGTASSDGARYSIYWRPTGGRIVGGDQIAGRSAAKDVGNFQNAGGADVFSLNIGDGQFRSAFCMTETPSTSAAFGLYGWCPNAMMHRATVTIQPTITARISDSDTVRTDDDAAALVELWKGKFRWSMRGALTQISEAGSFTWETPATDDFDIVTRDVNIGDRLLYVLGNKSDAETKIRINTTNSRVNTNDAEFEEEMRGVAASVTGVQNSADSALIPNELYLIGTCWAVLEERISEDPAESVFVSESEQEPVGEGNAMSYEFIVVREGTVQLVGPGFLDPPESGTLILPDEYTPDSNFDEMQSGTEDRYKLCSQAAQIFRMGIASFGAVRGYKICEVVLKSRVGISVNGMTGFKSCDTVRAINGKAGENQVGNTAGGTLSVSRYNSSGSLMTTKTRRYSSFLLQYSSDRGTTWTTFGASSTSVPPSSGPFSVTASTDAAAMAAALIGPGVNLVSGSAVYSGAAGASGFFSGDTSIFENPAGVSGVLLTTGSVANALPSNSVEDITQNNEYAGSNYLNSLVPGISTRDASTLTFRITLGPGTVGLQWTYVFGSDEYLEFVGSEYNDIFALSISDDGTNFTNLALVPSTSTPVAINNVNDTTNSQYYRDNPPGSNNYATQYDGLTAVLTSTATDLTPGVEYTLKFAIADAEDFSYDSGVFLLAGSIRGPVPTVAPVVFAVAGISGEEVYNYMRIAFPSHDRWEVRLVPVPSWWIRQSEISPIYVLDTNSGEEISVSAGGVSVHTTGYTIDPVESSVREISQLEPKRDIGLGFSDPEYDSMFDGYARFAEAFPYDNLQTTVGTSPEHTIAQVNFYENLGLTPSYESLGVVGINIAASLEINNLQSFSGFCNNGYEMPRLLDGDTKGSSHLFPDWLREVMTNPDLGALPATQLAQIDRDSFEAAAQWCQDRNYFYDAVEAEPLNILDWATDVAQAHLLKLVNSGGVYYLEKGIEFDDPLDIKAQFNNGNIEEGSFRLDSIDYTTRQPFAVLVKWREETAGPESPLFARERVALVREASTSANAPVKTLDLSKWCTSCRQAIDAACYYIRFVTLIDHRVTFRTTPDVLASRLKSGGFFELDIDVINYNTAFQGFVQDSGTIVSTRPWLMPLADGSYDALTWDMQTDPQEQTLTILDGLAEPANIFFAIPNTNTRMRTYEIKKIDIDGEGVISIQAFHHPTDEDGCSLLGKNWTTYATDANWVLEPNPVCGGSVDGGGGE